MSRIVEFHERYLNVLILGMLRIIMVAWMNVTQHHGSRRRYYIGTATSLLYSSSLQFYNTLRLLLLSSTLTSWHQSTEIALIVMPIKSAAIVYR